MNVMMMNILIIVLEIVRILYVVLSLIAIESFSVVTTLIIVSRLLNIVVS